jgi:succinate dehydrogenase flavin-adding protein (antitoxin of CptAB toxin-antitoxin module)
MMDDARAETRETRLRRLVYQSSYTGMKETDLLLGRFAKLHLPQLSDDELGQYEALLDAGDDRIYAWAVAGEPAPDIHNNRVLDLIKDFKND